MQLLIAIDHYFILHNLTLFFLICWSHIFNRFCKDKANEKTSSTRSSRTLHSWSQQPSRARFASTAACTARARARACVRMHINKSASCHAVCREAQRLGERTGCAHSSLSPSSSPCCPSVRASRPLVSPRLISRRRTRWTHFLRGTGASAISGYSRFGRGSLSRARAWISRRFPEGGDGRCYFTWENIRVDF